MSQKKLSSEDVKSKLTLFFEKHSAKALEFILFWPARITEHFIEQAQIFIDLNNTVSLIYDKEVIRLLVQLSGFFEPFLMQGRKNIWFGNYYCEFYYYEEPRQRIVIYKDLEYLAEKVHQRIVENQNIIRQAYNDLADDKILLLEIVRHRD